MLASPTSSFELLASHGEKTNKSKKIGEHHNKIFFQNVLTNNSDESNCWGHLAFDVLCVQFRKYFIQKASEGVCATKSRSALIPRPRYLTLSSRPARALVA
jgi:hypothetical protein